MTGMTLLLRLWQAWRLRKAQPEIDAAKAIMEIVRDGKPR